MFNTSSTQMLFLHLYLHICPTIGTQEATHILNNYTVITRVSALITKITCPRKHFKYPFHVGSAFLFILLCFSQKSGVFVEVICNLFCLLCVAGILSQSAVELEQKLLIHVDSLQINKILKGCELATNKTMTKESVCFCK